jgi:hypothetical protein
MATVANITAGDGFFEKLRCCRLFGWMIQLVPSENSSGVSLSIWTGMCAVASGLFQHTTDGVAYHQRHHRARARVMANLQELWFDVPVTAMYKDGNGGCHNLGLEYIPSHCKVRVGVDCEGASADDVEKAEAELRNAAQLHPNDGPRIKLGRRNQHKMVPQLTDQDVKEVRV